MICNNNLLNLVDGGIGRGSMCIFDSRTNGVEFLAKFSRPFQCNEVAVGNGLVSRYIIYMNDIEECRNFVLFIQIINLFIKIYGIPKLICLHICAFKTVTMN